MLSFFIAAVIAQVDPAPARAKAVITDQDGNEYRNLSGDATKPIKHRLGKQLVFSARKSTYAAGVEDSVKWTVLPKSVDDTKWVPGDGTEFSVTPIVYDEKGRPTDTPILITVILSVGAKGGATDHAIVMVQCGEGDLPPPGPIPPGPIPPGPVPPGPTPPGPTPPGPTPPGPTPPGPLSSFRVIFVHETGQTLTQKQRAVSDAAAVRAYLDSKTTKSDSSAGWHVWDRDVDPADVEDKTMASLWSAVKPKLTTVPCLVIERNGKAEILPWPADATASLKVLKQYGGE